MSRSEKNSMLIANGDLARGITTAVKKFWVREHLGGGGQLSSSIFIFGTPMASLFSDNKKTRNR